MAALIEDERIGSLVASRYRLDAILGRGSMGVVFEAVHTWTKRRVAVKVLNAEYTRDVGVVRRFLQEARAAAALRHAHVVEVLDMGAEPSGTVFLVLELLEGEPLSQMLARERKLAPADAIALLLPVMSALRAAHEHGVIHRDVKPQNVFIGRSEDRIVPKLFDFGLAKVAQSQSGRATQQGDLVGTPFYMAPEQIMRPHTVGPAADVWSIGVVLYQCLTGALPYDEVDPRALMQAIAAGKTTPLRERAPELPATLVAAVERALAPDPEQRYRDIASFAQALALAARDLEPAPSHEMLYRHLEWYGVAERSPSASGAFMHERPPLAHARRSAIVRAARTGAVALALALAASLVTDDAQPSPRPLSTPPVGGALLSPSTAALRARGATEGVDERATVRAAVAPSPPAHVVAETSAEHPKRAHRVTRDVGKPADEAARADRPAVAPARPRSARVADIITEW